MLPLSNSVAAAVPRRLATIPPGRRGTSLQLSNFDVFRWLISGLSDGHGGRVYLEAVKRGKSWISSEAAVARFFGALPTAPTPQLPPPPLRTPSRRPTCSCPERRSKPNTTFDLASPTRQPCLTYSPRMLAVIDDWSPAAATRNCIGDGVLSLFSTKDMLLGGMAADGIDNVKSVVGVDQCDEFPKEK